MHLLCVCVLCASAGLCPCIQSACMCPSARGCVYVRVCACLPGHAPTAEALQQLQKQHALVMLEIDLLKQQLREKGSLGKHRQRRSPAEGPHTSGRLSELRGTP
eukprot:EG_transcript_38503